MLGLQNETDTLRPKQSIPRGAGGLHRAGIREYVALGMTTKKHRSVETALTTAGSMRRIANAAGLTTPFVEMTTKEVKALAVAIQSYVNPRSEEPNPRPYQVLLRSILDYHAAPTEDEADKKRLLAARNLIKPAKMKASKIGPDDILTTDELNRLLDATTSKRDRVLLIALLETGGRVTEVLSLNVESLTRHQNGGNGGRPWYKAWFSEMKEEGTEHFGYFREPATVALIDSWLKEYPSGVDVSPRPLIPSLSFAANSERRLNADSVGDLLQAVAEKAGVEQKKQVHALRDGCGRLERPLAVRSLPSGPDHLRIRRIDVGLNARARRPRAPFHFSFLVGTGGSSGVLPGTFKLVVYSVLS